ncbi:endonuclease domain-containing protein [Streptomyces sp. NPDC039022]|uniref:endonuclease domain-containing protein n=1 Tax=Streptomyces sp. NPDC039022 TaxID=3157091 RepID=UPI0033F0AF93
MKLHYSTMSSAAKKAYLLAHPTCPICGGITNDIDHEHPTDLVRDALCHRCNCRVSSLERALMIPTRLFQTLAGDLHRGYARTGRVNLARFADDLASPRTSTAPASPPYTPSSPSATSTGPRSPPRG